MKDSEIIKLVRLGKNEKPIKFLYKEFPKIKALIIKSGGSSEMAEEIFNDSLVLLIEKLQKPNFELSSKLTSYLYGINRFLLKNELRKLNKSNYDLEWNDTLIISNEDLEYDFEKEQQLSLMEKILEQISEKCKEILRLFYFQKEKMENIASTLNFSSVNSAKTQKYKCLEKASKMANEMLTHQNL